MTTRQTSMASQAKTAALIGDVTAKVSDPFKYVRIDMYAVGDRLYVGELTHSPGACWDVFSIPAYDYWAGAPYYAPSDKERI